MQLVVGINLYGSAQPGRVLQRNSESELHIQQLLCGVSTHAWQQALAAGVQASGCTLHVSADPIPHIMTAQEPSPHSSCIQHTHKGGRTCRWYCCCCSAQARMHKDMARLETQRQELSDRITSLQASIFKGSEKLDQVQSSARLLLCQTGGSSGMLTVCLSPPELACPSVTRTVPSWSSASP